MSRTEIPSSPCSCPSCGRRVERSRAQFPFCSERCQRVERICHRPGNGDSQARRAPAAPAGRPEQASPEWHEFIFG